MCHGGWTGASCSARVANFCPNGCSDSLRRSAGTPTVWTPAGGQCNTATGGCTCRREYTDSTGTWSTHDTALCEANEGDCYSGTDW